MSKEFQVCIKGKLTEDDGLRIEIPITEENWFREIFSGRCPDCGGEWIWYEKGFIPGTRKCVGEIVWKKDGGVDYNGVKGCGSWFTVLGHWFDEDEGKDARARMVAVLRRQRFYEGEEDTKKQPLANGTMTDYDKWRQIAFNKPKKEET